MDQIEQVRQKTDIVELINSYISLNKAGRNFKALCPFHSEKTPSFIVSPERQIFKCFGCGEGGSVFNFLMKYESMEFGEALRFLADRAGIKLKRLQPSKAYQEKEKLLAVNHLASEFYHYILAKHQAGKKGLDYLLARGINQASIRDFKLGYAPEAWENLQDYLVKKKGYSLLELAKAGLIIKGRKSFYDRFRGRIIFPLFDHRGNTVGFAGRVLTGNSKGLPARIRQPAEKAGAKYINTPETVLYHKGDLLYGLHLTKKDIREKNKVIIAEGELDVISSYQAGVKNAIALKGSALTENQVSLLKRFTENIVLALDEDTAGDAAARRGIELADEAGLNIRVIELQYGKDPDECARHSGKLWRQSVKRAIPIYDFYLKSAVERFGKKSGESKKRISEELVPIWAKISNEVVKAHYLKKLADLLKVNEEAVVREIERWEKKESLKGAIRKPVPEAKDEKEEKSRREKIEELLLALILQKEKAKKKWLDELEAEFFKSAPIQKILKALNDFLGKLGKKKFKINQFVKKLPEEIVSTLDRLYLQDLKIDLKNEKKANLEFGRARKELEKLFIREKLSQLVEEIRNMEKKGEKSKLKAKEQEFNQLSSRIKELA